MKTIIYCLSAFLAFSFLMSCGDDEEPVCATYEADIKPIIDASCAYSGCHSGADAGMFVTDISKDYTSYEGILATLEGGSFAIRTLDSLNMPPPGWTPVDKPQTLTQAELDIITCWVEAGYPKN